jgi:hypothetical protein
MATFIALKQIESGSSLEAAAEIGSDFSQSVISIVSSSVVGVLPDGIISSSAQVELMAAGDYGTFTASLNTTYATDYELEVTTSVMDSGEF